MLFAAALIFNNLIILIYTDRIPPRSHVGLIILTINTRGIKFVPPLVRILITPLVRRERRKFPVRVTQKRGGIAEDDGCATYERYTISVLPKSSIVKRKETAGTVITLPLRAETGRLNRRFSCRGNNNFMPSNLVPILYDNRGCTRASEFACEDRNELSDMCIFALSAHCDRPRFLFFWKVLATITDGIIVDWFVSDKGNLYCKALNILLIMFDELLSELLSYICVVR